MNRNLVYVERTVITTENVAMIVRDDDDLKAQLADHEVIVRNFKYVGKAQKDSSGKTEFHKLNSDWDVKS